MKSDPLNTLFNDEPTEAEAQVDQEVEQAESEPEAQTEAAEPAPDAVQDGEKGEPAATPAAVDAKGQSIPLTALLDEREKRQKAEREAEELRAWRADMEARQAQSKQPKPDFFDNPEAALQAERASVTYALWNERLNMSEMLARQAHGDELVAEATEAFAAAARQNPAMAMELQRQANPYAHVIQWHKRQQVLSKIGDDPDAYIERLVQERLASMQAAPAQPVQTQRPATPPRSIASATSAGGVSEPPVSGFDTLFPGY